MTFKAQKRPGDAIFALRQGYLADDHPQKIDLSMGAYRSEDGAPWILPCVKEAEQLIIQDIDTDHEYLNISGCPLFLGEVSRLIFGPESSAIKENRVTSLQSVSGTSANHLAAAFLALHPPFEGRGTIYIPSPTWVNHTPISQRVGLNIQPYPYFDPATNGFHFQGMLDTLEKAHKGDIVLLHACAHNPTGVDPTQEQWRKIGEVVQRKGLFPFFDFAYQGFASGDPDADAYAVRYFVEHLKLACVVCQSFSKNFGLYGERVGAVHFVCSDQEEAEIVLSIVKTIIRSEYSSPPAYGSRIVHKVLSTPHLREQWLKDLRTMSSRIASMRRLLRQKLEDLDTPGRWNHITEQIGMFSYTGLNAKQCNELVSKYHIYLADTGRISMAGLNVSNLDYASKCIHEVVTGTQK